MRILIVEDHKLIADTFQFKFEAMGNKVVTAGTLAEARKAIKNPDTRPEVVLLDFYLPDSHGFDGLKSLAQESEPPIVVMSGMLNGWLVQKVRSTGAKGFISKDNPVKLVRSILHFVADGGSYFLPETFQGTGESVAAAAKGMSETNQKILALLARGCNNREIARALNMDEHNVKAHLRTIFRCLGVSNRTQAALLVYDHKLAEVICQS